MPRVVLASASPRRRALLAEAGVSFVVESSDADETLAPDVAPEEAARLLAERKARAVLEQHRGEELLIVGADTIVAVGEGGRALLLGKPADAAEARAMLERLSGSRHQVVTGVCVARAADGAVFVEHERTWVTMRVITPAEVDAYVASGEWLGKAGGYAIQETADAFVTALEEGGFDNVVGLPVERTRALLARAAGA